jgi:hypothetical protein
MGLGSRLGLWAWRVIGHSLVQIVQPAQSLFVETRFGEYLPYSPLQLL